MFETPPAKRHQVAWGESFHFIFREPNWMLTILLGGICQLIPVIGPLVLMGYAYEVLVDLTVTGGATYRPFDFNRFMAYLKRGAWPFLVSLVVGLILVPVLYVLMILGALLVVGLANAVGDDAAPVVVVIFGVLGFLLYLALVIGLNVVLQPMFLRSALMMEFGQGFQMAFVRDYLHRVFGEKVKVILYLTLVSLPLVLAGFLACFVGIYAAVVVMMLMQVHLQFQVYEIYRTRGGEVVPIVSAD